MARELRLISLCPGGGQWQVVTLRVLSLDWCPSTSSSISESALIKCIFSRFADDMKLSDVVHTTEGWVAIPRDLGKLEKWAPKNFMRLSKWKCRWCTSVGAISDMSTDWGMNRWTAAWQDRKGYGILVDVQYSSEGKSHPRLHLKWSDPPHYSAPVKSCLDYCIQVWRTQIKTWICWVGSEKDHENDLMVREPLLWRQAGGVSLVHPAEEAGWGRPL